MSETDSMAFIGFGEAGQAFATGFARPAGTVFAHDRKLDDGVLAGDMRGTCAAAGVLAVTAAELAQTAPRFGAVFCLVTADQAVAAARAVAPHLAAGTLWLDGNSCAPNAKRAAAAVIEAAGARYVDMAVMAPVNPRLHRTPVLLSGPHAAAAQALAENLGMQSRVAGAGVGDASTIKMLRSVVIKGLEALTAESFLAARRAGVEHAVIASLQASDPGYDWAARGAYNLERMLNHGQRRAAEMREVAATLRDLGIPDAMSEAAVIWQDRLGQLDIDAGPDELAPRADLILSRLS